MGPLIGSGYFKTNCINYMYNKSVYIFPSGFFFFIPHRPWCLFICYTYLEVRQNLFWSVISNLYSLRSLSVMFDLLYFNILIYFIMDCYSIISVSILTLNYITLFVFVIKLYIRIANISFLQPKKGKQMNDNYNFVILQTQMHCCEMIHVIVSEITLSCIPLNV